MYNVRKAADDLWWVGANDRHTSLFENIHPIPRGVTYNSYLLLDESTVLFDGVDHCAVQQLLENVEHLLDGRGLDYIVLHHMEPDHSSGLRAVLERWPEAKIMAGGTALRFLDQFGLAGVGGERIELKEGDVRSFGKHSFTFLSAPMVHWPDVMMSYDAGCGVLLSADAFGSFGTLDGALFNDEVDFPGAWLDDARRYYANIVGKYGPQVQAVLKKAGALDIKTICPLHGPVWRTDLGWFLEKYHRWSRYEPEDREVVIVFGSMYGNTEQAADALASALVERGVRVKVYDVSQTHVSVLVSEVFRASHVVLSCVTYNMDFYPPMHAFLEDLKALNVQNRTFATLSNGCWVPTRAGDLMGGFVKEQLKGCRLLESKLTMLSSLPGGRAGEVALLADAIAADVKQ